MTILEQAIEDGIIARKSECEQCGANGTFKDGRTEVQAHHGDYNKPLDVTWLCQKCHHEWHIHNKAVEREVMPDESTGELRPTIISGGFPR